MNSTVKTVIALISGTAAGLTIGWLTAPRSGEETREKLMKDMDAARNMLEETANEKIEELKKKVNKLAEKQASTSKKAIDNVKESVKVS